MSEHKYKRQSGNVLWFILIAVALLGMLTMVLTRSGSTVDQSADIEQLRITAGQLLGYSKSIEAAVQNMKLRGISERDISFQNPTTATDYTNANCLDNACRIFHVDGAGLTYRNFAGANDGSDWIFTGANNVGTTAGPVGSTAAVTGNDLIMLLPNVNQTLCIQINRDLSVGTAGTLPIDDEIDTAAFIGTYAPGGPTILEGDTTNLELNRKNAGCFIDANDSNKIYFYQVLLAR